MPVYSMTGYFSVQTPAANATLPAEDDGSTTTAALSTASARRISVDIRSVNSRFLDLTFKLPDELRAHEPALRELLTRHLKRGKVELRATLEAAEDPAAALAEPRPELLQRLARAQDTVIAWLPQARPLSVADVLRLAAPLRSNAAAATAPSSASTTDSGREAALLTLAAQAVDGLLAARAREGERLAQMLTDRLAQLRQLASRAQPLVPQLVEQQRQRFLERWQDALAQAQSAPPGQDAASRSAPTQPAHHPSLTPQAAQERALTEATAFAIRIDVAEELTRLAAHLDEITRLLDTGGDIGKRLDFLIQELHREANTLGSKSAVIELTRISVDMKVLIEQMREQVQNIE